MQFQIVFIDGHLTSFKTIVLKDLKQIQNYTYKYNLVCQEAISESHPLGGAQPGIKSARLYSKMALSENKVLLFTH